MLPSDIQAQSLANTACLFLYFWGVECEKAGIASSIIVYLASPCPILAKGDSSAVKMEFPLFPICLSCRFSDMICNEQFVSIWLSCVWNQEIPAPLHYLRDAAVCQLLHCMFSLERKFLQRLEQHLHDGSVLFWGILKGAKYLWAQGSPKILWCNSAVQFKVKASALWSMICHSYRPQRLLCERNQQSPSSC